MADSKIVITKIENLGYPVFIHGKAPINQKIAAYYEKAGQWLPLGTYVNQETNEFKMQASNTPSKGRFDVVVCLDRDGGPPNASCSDRYSYDFPDNG
ncbi:hypothetical protein [Pseudomonas frederiksbergensis]|jgi:hypothetical protein|uniref:hypothetical protein n=1 Tax=Pseudomonas frederiksbergensis TaxID=104087 RepID=UPI003D249A99